MRARIWLAIIAVASVAVLVGLHLGMSYLELGWCDDRHDLPGACRVVRAPVDWFKTRVMGMPDEASCATPLHQLRDRGARVWITDGAFLPDGGALLAARFAMKRGAVPQKLARLLADGRPDEDFEPGRECAPAFRLFRPLAEGVVALIGGAPDASDDLTRLTLVERDGTTTVQRPRGVCGVASGNIRDAALEARGSLLLAGTFESGSDNPVLARLDRDGRCITPFEPPGEPIVPEAIAGVMTDGRVALRLRPPQELPLMRYLGDGGIDVPYSAQLQLTLREAGVPFPLDAQVAADGSAVLTFQDGLGSPTLLLVDPSGQARNGIPVDRGAFDRRIGEVRPLPDGSVLLTVDGRSRATAETLSVPPARLWRLMPDGTVDAGFAENTKAIGAGAGEIRVLDIAKDGQMLVLALWYGRPPRGYTWPWPIQSEVYVLDRNGRRLTAFAAPPF